MTELLENAVTGVNIIPTALLGFILFYWLIVMIGLIDIDFFDLDLDGDCTCDASGFYAILVFLNIDKLPFMLVMSISSLIFWIISMFFFYLPIEIGGLVNAVLLIPALLISFLITKFVTSPLKGILTKDDENDDRFNSISGQRCTLLCDVKDGRLGQANIQRDGADILINVKSQYVNDTFIKGEKAFVIRKDVDKNIFYIIKVKIKNKVKE